MRLLAPIKKLVELISPTESPVASLPKNHPNKQYVYTLVGYNDSALTAESLRNLKFFGKVRNSIDFVEINNQLLWRSLDTTVQIAILYNIPKIRKYRENNRGIDWEFLSRDIYKELISSRLFYNPDE